MKSFLLGLVIALAGLTTTLWPATTQAYGGTGHAAFCEAAYQFAAPATQKKIDAMVAQHPDYDSFGALCSWADHIKSDEKWDWAKPHHYVNFPHERAKVTAQDCPVQGGCILSAIQHHYDVLTHNPNDWVALAFLAHFIGDLHQPLHVSFADDLGGNRASVVYFDQPTNLHRLWDTDMLVHRGGESGVQQAEQLVRGAVSLSPLTVTPEQTLSWANESAAITRRIYSQYRENQELGNDYTAQWGPVLEQRIQQGAQRLAAVLDGLYK